MPKSSVMRFFVLALTAIVIQLTNCAVNPQTDSALNQSKLSNFNNESRTVTPKILNAELDKNRSLWNEKKISNYNLEMSLDIGGGYAPVKPVTVEVRNNMAVSIKPVNPVKEEGTNFYDAFNTVQKLFSEIQKGYERGVSVEVKYNESLGYPEETRIINQNVIDSVLYVKISKLDIVNND